jgi:hypothetical protein
MRLSDYRRRVTSQNGEDGIIERIFEIMPPANKWCVEVGALDGFTFSNTYNLITSHQWSSVQIEGSAKYFRKLHDRYEGNPRVRCIFGRVWHSGRRTMDRRLAGTPTPKDFDFLSLDLDGQDYNVWDVMVDYRPRLVMIEFNDTMPDYVSYVQRKEPTQMQGSSLKAITDLGRKKGYELICVNEPNAFYVLREHYRLFGIEDNSLSGLWVSRGYHTHVFELFDHTLVMSGYGKWQWGLKHRGNRKFNLINGDTNEPIRHYTDKK